MVDTSADTRDRLDGGVGADRIAGGNGSHPEELSALIGELRQEFDRSLLAFRRTIVLQTARAKVAVLGGLFGAALGVVGGLVGLVIVALGTVLVVLGIRGGLRAATDGAWWVDVLLGAVLLGSIAGGIVWMRSRVQRKALAATRDRLAAMSDGTDPLAHAQAEVA